MSDGIPLPPPGGTPERIGKYRILRQIAQGGMAEIYLASASGIEGFEKLCVLKRILPLLATNREFVQMFLDEARIAASLLHSNIAQVFDIGEDRGSYYFVMEFLRGEDARHILQGSVDRNAFIPYEHITTIITGVCAGLHHAHEMRGKDGRPLHLVHRDISPQNIFVTHEGGVKLCDFGIAKSAAQLTETRVGTLKGKIRYMSPEQCRSEPLDRRSDVFALSIVLWEMVTLRRLFTGKSDFEIFKAIVEEPLPSPSDMRRDVPAELERIIMKGLSREREDRFQSAQELQLALEDWARNDRIPASSVRLGTFMTELFGPPQPDVESYLERTTDADPLARRIRSSPAGVLDPVRNNGPLFAGDTPPGMREFLDDELALADEDDAEDEDEERTGTRGPRGQKATTPMRAVRDDPTPLAAVTAAHAQLHEPPADDPPAADDDGLAETLAAPAVPPTRRGPRLLLGLAVLACGVALAALGWRIVSYRPSTPVAAPAVAAPVVQAPPPSPPPPPVPAVPTQAEEPGRATTEAQKPGTIARPAPARPPVRRPPPKKAVPAKKRGSLDDLLPP